MKTTTQADPKYLTIVHRSRGKQQGQKFLPAIFLGRWSKFELMASMLYLGQLRRRARDTEYARNGHRKGNDIRLLFAYRTKVRIEQVARHSIESRINRAAYALVLKWLMPGRCTTFNFVSCFFCTATFFGSLGFQDFGISPRGFSTLKQQWNCCWPLR
jgi:hypothetical protein